MKTLGAAVLALGLAAVSPAQAQNDSSFTQSASSTVNYTHADVRPRLPCEALRVARDPLVTILATEVIAAADGVPEHCRVSGVIAPEIGFEVNLPAAWNRRFYMHGNGGFAGERPDMPVRAARRAEALKRNFTTATTNTGHDAQREPLGSFALNQQKVLDYGFRAVNLTAVTARRMAARYYGRPAAYSYWDGCSTGGRQGLIEAQRYPLDFDGVLAGAPVLNLADTPVGGLWIAKALEEAPITLDKLKVVADATYAKCDAADGIKDGVIDDPRKCDFDATRDVPICRPGQNSTDCLTAAEATTVKKIQTGVTSNGKPYFYPIIPVGTEAVGLSSFGGSPPASGWERWVLPAPGGPPKGLQLVYAESFTKYLIFGRADANFDPKSFDFDKDVARTQDFRRIVNATDPDLTAFRNRGGKLLIYHGWADPAVTPYQAVDYYEQVTRRHGADTQNFARLFMVPGMFHCRGGVGVDRFDGMTPLIEWVEQGVAPPSLLASRVLQNQVARTRPLCPYPQVARHKGTGSTDEAANFECKPTE